MNRVVADFTAAATGDKIAYNPVHSWSTHNVLRVNPVRPSGLDGLQYGVEIQSIADLEELLA